MSDAEPETNLDSGGHSGVTVETERAHAEVREQNVLKEEHYDEGTATTRNDQAICYLQGRGSQENYQKILHSTEAKTISQNTPSAVVIDEVSQERKNTVDAEKIGEQNVLEGIGEQNVLEGEGHDEGTTTPTSDQAISYSQGWDYKESDKKRDLNMLEGEHHDEGSTTPIHDQPISYPQELYSKENDQKKGQNVLEGECHDEGKATSINDQTISYLQGLDSKENDQEGEQSVMERELHEKGIATPTNKQAISYQHGKNSKEIDQKIPHSTETKTIGQDIPSTVLVPEVSQERKSSVNTEKKPLFHTPSPSEDSLVYTATPSMVFEEKEKAFFSSNPLNLVWSFGINQNIPVYNLHDKTRQVILYTCAHTAVMLDCSTNTQHVFQGHCSPISSVCVSEDRRWVVTADKGLESLIIIWDSYSGIPVQTLFDSHPEGGVAAIAMTGDSKYLATVGAGTPQQVCIWDWASDKEGPLCSKDLDSSYGYQAYMIFDPKDNFQLISSSSTQVIFYLWTFNKVVGKFTQSIFHFTISQALTATSVGNLVVWDAIQISNAPAETEIKPHNKKAIKLVPMQKDEITVLTVSDRYIVTGDVRGFIRFYDSLLNLVNWYSSFNLGPIQSISFSKELPHPATGQTHYPADCTIQSKPFVIRNFVVSTSDASVVHVTADGTKVEALLQEANSTVYAIACHPEKPIVCIASYSGMLKVWDYKKKKYICSRIFKAGQYIHCLTYNIKGTLLGVGFTDGSVQILESLTLKDECAEPFRYASAPITHMSFSHDSQYLATADEGFTVTVYKISQENGNTVWAYLGRMRSHYKLIQTIMFGIHPDNNQPRLLSLGSDRVLVEYDFPNSSKNDLRILGTDRIEQSGIPKCMAWYPPITKESFILTANDQYKMKLFNSTTKMCRKTLLGPTYISPLEKMIILPRINTHNPGKQYLAYITKDKVGLQILPVDGNPHKSSAIISHPGGVYNLACSYDGAYLFTAGGEDCTVLMWEVNIQALEAAAALGGTDLIPFYALLDGGREGELFKELEDYFYYAQLRSQGIDTMDTRQVSTHIPLVEVPFVMRALGFYPSEQEVEDMLNEIKFSEYVDTGKYVTSIDLGDFIRLYINHRPAFGLSVQELQHAFDTLGCDSESGEKTMERGQLLQLLQIKGEHMTEEELAEYFTTLLGLNPEGGRCEIGSYDSKDAAALLEKAIPSKMTHQIFTVELLGLQTGVSEEESSEEPITACTSAMS
ncbi:cilia- and flagella-associated protein 251 isoform X2 [Protopterus annectens]|uniref:cilia- and flagella-associated protein 251 isoform X2 n=1 Tax=Protopterus annectens TaxID=7888 RepID=UPI001CFB2A20|nr:cilia- and flagella-associated protein 251 isoform X2 [Protopterus annectens]